MSGVSLCLGKEPDLHGSSKQQNWGHPNLGGNLFQSAVAAIKKFSFSGPEKQSQGN